MRTLDQDVRSARRPEFRQFSAVARVASVAVLGMSWLLAACEGEDAIPSYDYRPTTRFCPGAYTPQSEVCWTGNDGGDEGPITANSAAAMENIARFDNMDRCLPGIIGAPGTVGKLTVSFATQKLTGKYTPRNCGAVWIEDAFGFYVRTLELWAAERQPSVVAWSQSACSKDSTIADAITSATLDKPAEHTSTWNTEDFRKNVVPDGVYTLWMQVTENEIFPEGPFMKIDFTKGSAPFTLKPTAEQQVQGFVAVTLTYTPNDAAAPPATAP
jgi:hypothetical protein